MVSPAIAGRVVRRADGRGVHLGHDGLLASAWATPLQDCSDQCPFAGSSVPEPQRGTRLPDWVAITMAAETVALPPHGGEVPRVVDVTLSLATVGLMADCRREAVSNFAGAPAPAHGPHEKRGEGREGRMRRMSGGRREGRSDCEGPRRSPGSRRFRLLAVPRAARCRRRIDVPQCRDAGSNGPVVACLRSAAMTASTEPMSGLQRPG